MRRLSAVILTLLLAASSAAAERGSEKQVIRVGAGTTASKAAPISDGVFLRLESVTFDPLQSLTDYSEVGLSNTPSTDYWIVQLDPDVPGARERLVAAGVKPIGYLPDHAFRVRMTDHSREAIDAAEGVRWAGPYLPGYKVHSSLWQGSGDTADEIVVVLFPSEDPARVARKLEALSGGVFTLRVTEDNWMPRLVIAVPLSGRDEVVRAASRLEAVSWIEPRREIRLHNNNALGPVQSGTTGGESTTIFAHGLTGTGQIAAVADSGADIDMCYFRNLNGTEAVTPASETIAPEMGTFFPTNKVVGYWVQENADAYDNNEACGESPPTGFHGTHTSSSVLGDNLATPSSPTNPGVDPGDGMAPNAQLLFQDIGAANGCLVVTEQLGLMFEQAYRGGARLHNNSWGTDSSGTYTLLDAETDRFLFDNSDMAIFVSAGNAGPVPSTVGSPAVSKSVLAVGAVGSGNSTTIARFSSRGPSNDGRTKPDIVAPGTSIISAGGDATSGNGNCGTSSKSGTSMASPITTGAATLLRQYFADGFYPTGQRNPADEFEPSGTLVKAALLNGAFPLPIAGEFGGQAYGWGRVFLDSNLYFEGDDRDLRIFDLPNVQGIQTGRMHDYEVTVEEGEELRVTLVWYDPESTLGAAKDLVNDLDLIVSDGTSTFLGNNFGPTGESVTGGSADSLNTTEQVRLTAPPAGTYTVTVKGTSVPGTGRSSTDRQGYALVVSSAACGTGVVSPPTGLNANANPIFGIDLTWTPASGSTSTQVYRAVSGTEDFRFIGTTTDNSFTDVRAQGGITYVYRIRGTDGCGEGPASQPLTITATGACDLKPRFFGITRATANSPECSITLEWAAATSACALGDGVNYNIYRSTDPDLFAEDPIATVANVTRFEDTAVESSRQYHYIVRAEERVSGGTGPNGGNEERNSAVRSAVVVGPPGEIGTWTDDGGDTTALLTGDFPWRIALGESQAGSRSYHAGIRNGDYTPDTCASLVTPGLSLGSGAILTYWARYDLELNWDGVVVEISTDDGETWDDLPPDIGYPDTLSQTQNPPVNACGYPANRGAFTGPQLNGQLTEWTEYETDLSSFAGQSVRIRWRLTTDPGLEFEGFYLDTISITNVAIPGACIPATINPPRGIRPRG